MADLTKQQMQANAAESLNRKVITPSRDSRPCQSIDNNSPKWHQTVTLLVGPESVPFTAHRHFLNTIPFFETCLRVQMHENAELIVGLPEDEATVIEEILEYAYNSRYDYPFNGWANDHPDHDHPDLPADTAIACLQRIKVYITADKLGMDNYGTMVLNDMERIQFVAPVSLDLVKAASKHFENHPRLKDILLRAVIADIKKMGWKKWEQSNAKVLEDFLGEAKYGLMLIHTICEEAGFDKDMDEKLEPEAEEVESDEDMGFGLFN